MRMHLRLSVLLIVSLLAVAVLGVGQSFAQIPSDIPAGADPSRFGGQLPGQVKPEQPLQAPSIQDPSPQDLGAPPEAASYRFVLKGVVVEGSSIWTPQQLATLWQHMVGREVSVADVYGIRDRLTQKYQSEGYFLSRAIIPEQEIDGGIIKIAIVEGYIREAVFSQSDYPERMAREVINRITSKRPINIRDLESQLMVLNAAPGCAASSVLLPLRGDSALHSPGGVRLELIFRCDENKNILSFDNYGSKYVGPWQYGISRTFNHSTVVPGSLSASVFLSPQIEELRFISVQDQSQISSSGLILKTALQKSWSEPGSDLRVIDLYSRLLSGSVGLEYPLMLSRSESLKINTSFAYKNIESDIISTRFYDDRLRVIDAGVSYDRSFSTGTLIAVSGILSQGLDIMGARETGSEDLSREGGHTDFTKTKIDVALFQSLPANFNISLQASGQYAAVALLSSEEFGYGGYSLGRAYDNSEITGDSGVGAILELTWNKYSAYSGGWAYPSMQPFVYVDGGKVWNDDQGGAIDSGMSVGFGVRLGWGENAQVSGTLAQPLTRSIENPAYGNGHNPRFLLSATLSF